MLRSKLVLQFNLLWRFLGFFQAPRIRMLHAVVVLLVCWQLLTGWLMPFPDGFLGWSHILGGLACVVFGATLIVTSLRQRGFPYFFPYLWGDIAQLKKDLIASMQFKMIPPRPKGLATVVQGLGMGALGLALLSGLCWFLLRGLGAHGAASVVREIHESVVVLVELYFLGHGSMALLHFVSWQKKTKPKA